MTRHTTTGNARPWEVAKGYTYTTRQDLPLVTEAEPIRWGVIAWPIAIGLAAALIGAWR